MIVHTRVQTIESDIRLKELFTCLLSRLGLKGIKAGLIIFCCLVHRFLKSLKVIACGDFDRALYSGGNTGRKQTDLLGCFRKLEGFEDLSKLDTDRIIERKQSCLLLDFSGKLPSNTTITSSILFVAAQSSFQVVKMIDQRIDSVANFQGVIHLLFACGILDLLLVDDVCRSSRRGSTLFQEGELASGGLFIRARCHRLEQQTGCFSRGCDS
mmetsp:Transcript_11320/g.28551  ORF Transcript_11320/g.28551 Transcript_11320/m.28551 type:complete len:212 (-) Transcript_11320:744-1379(-)